jgi:integrase
VRFLTYEEESLLLLACNATLRPVVQVALCTCLRKKELLGLQWRDVNLDRQVVIVREVPLNRSAWTLLAGLKPKEAHPESAVFLNRLGKPYVQVDTLYRAAVARAGIKNFRFHDLRHTFASRLVMAGVSLAALRALLGHQDYAMTLRYAHLANEHKRDAVEMLSREFSHQMHDASQDHKPPDRRERRIWREYATDVRGQSLPCGHHLPEEMPDETYAVLEPFVKG